MDRSEKPTPRAFPAAPPTISVSPDALDRLLGALGTMSSSVDEMGKKLDEAIRDGKMARYVMVETRKDVGALDAKVVEIAEDVSEIDGRLTTAERGIRRHDAGFKSSSDTDAKHESELAALVIAIDETRKLAKKAITEIGELKKNTGSIVSQGETALAKVDEEVKAGQKTAGPVKAAAALNLAIGIVYLLLKLLEHKP